MKDTRPGSVKGYAFVKKKEPVYPFLIGKLVFLTLIENTKNDICHVSQYQLKRALH